MGKSIGRITFFMQPFLARKFKNLLQYRATNSKVPNETFLIVLKHFEIVHTIFEDSTLYIASKTYPLARNTLYNLKVYQMHHLEFYSLKHGMVGNIWIFAPKMAASKMWFYQSICPSFGFTLRYYPMKCIENSALDIASKSGHLGWDTL